MLLKFVNKFATNRRNLNGFTSIPTIANSRAGFNNDSQHSGCWDAPVYSRKLSTEKLSVMSPGPTFHQLLDCCLRCETSIILRKRQKPLWYHNCVSFSQIQLALGSSSSSTISGIPQRPHSPAWPPARFLLWQIYREPCLSPPYRRYGSSKF